MVGIWKAAEILNGLRENGSAVALEAWDRIVKNGRKQAEGERSAALQRLSSTQSSVRPTPTAQSVASSSKLVGKPEKAPHTPARKIGTHHSQPPKGGVTLVATDMQDLTAANYPMEVDKDTTSTVHVSA
jgi:hypothetical protein